MAATATALTGSSKIQINLKHIKLDAAKLNEVLDKLSINAGPDWLYGIGPNKANLLYHAKDLACTASTPSAVDISGTAIQDAFGDDCTFSLLKLLYIYNKDETEDLLVGGLSNQVHIARTNVTESPQEFGVVIIKPGGYLLWVDPIGMDVTSEKLLQIWAETAHCTYDIALMGEAV